MSPQLQHKDDCWKLQVMLRVIVLMSLQLLRSISDRLTILHQYITQTNSRSITKYGKTYALLRQGQVKDNSQQLLDLSRDHLINVRPLKYNPFLIQLGQRIENIRGTLDKASIISH